MATGRQTRREFFVRTASGLAVIGAGAALLTRCGGASATSPGGATPQLLPTIAGNVVNGAITVAIDASSPLGAAGGMALVRSSAGDVLVARTSDTAFSALSALCTHQACEITGYSGSTFVCPCHGSEYDTNGRVLTGPAPLPLPHVATQFVGGVLTIGPA